MKKIFVLVIIPGLLFAIKYKETSINRLIETSAIVIEGNIKSKDSYWSNGKIFTDYKVKVTYPFKGFNKEIITIQLLGGRVADKELTIHGMPDIKIGDSGLFFIVSHNGNYILNSMGMGYFKTSAASSADKEKIYYNTNVPRKILTSGIQNSKHPQNPVVSKSDLVKKIAAEENE